MSIDLEKMEEKLKSEVKKKPEKVALECNYCGRWSAYGDFNDKLPRGWEEGPGGYKCTNCIDRRKR